MASVTLIAPGTPSTGPVTREAIGNKAANLATLASAGFPVPPAFALPTEVCRHVLDGDESELAGLLASGLRSLEEATGQRFGAARRPLLVSVRSGAVVSMPGMLETILNVGLSSQVLPGWIRATGNPRLAWDAYRRLVQAYAEVVHGVSPAPFERALAGALARAGARSERELDTAGLRALTGEFLGLFADEVGRPFPQTPMDQLVGAVSAVFHSWRGEKAVAYRRHHGIDDAMGTAALVQAMVFGNAGGTSGTGVAFTRDPGTGEKRLYLDFLFDAQGEDVVSGRRIAHGADELARVAPGLHAELGKVSQRLERLFRDAQDFEFTVEGGRLFLLQTRDAQRTPWARLCIAVALVREGLLDERAGLQRLAGLDLETISRTRLIQPPGPPLARAIPASPGVAVGHVEFDVATAVARARSGQDVILVRRDTSTSDLPGILAARGILTAVGSRTAHAAVVSRQLGKACLVGCSDLRVDSATSGLIGSTRVGPADLISLDGSTGEVFAGALEAEVQRPDEELGVVRGWLAEAGRSGR